MPRSVLSAAGRGLRGDAPPKRGTGNSSTPREAQNAASPSELGAISRHGISLWGRFCGIALPAGGGFGHEKRHPSREFGAKRQQEKPRISISDMWMCRMASPENGRETRFSSLNPALCLPISIARSGQDAPKMPVQSLCRLSVERRRPPCTSVCRLRKCRKPESRLEQGGKVLKNWPSEGGKVLKKSARRGP